MIPTQNNHETEYFECTTYDLTTDQPPQINRNVENDGVVKGKGVGGNDEMEVLGKDE